MLGWRFANGMSSQQDLTNAQMFFLVELQVHRPWRKTAKPKCHVITFDKSVKAKRLQSYQEPQK